MKQNVEASFLQAINIVKEFVVEYTGEEKRLGPEIAA